MLRWGAMARATKRRIPSTPSAFLIAVGLALLYMAGLIEPLDRVLFEQRLSLLTRPASGSLVVVEIDARSIQELETWPWPRRYHAQVIDRLLAAGAQQIAIDIDFSARSNATEDAALAAAIARAGSRLILPAFVQAASARERTALTESIPSPELTARETGIGTVNVLADADGRIWRYAIGFEIAGSYRPSLAALLAGTASYASQAFYVDYSIREDALVTLSFVDVLNGRFDPALLAGRKVIIGATATELGDVQAVPVYRTLAGVFVQALAYETLVQGRAIARVAGSVTVIGLFALLPVIHLATRRRRAGWKRSLLVALTIAAAIIALSIAVQEFAALALDVATWLVALAAWSVAGLIRALQSQSYRLLRRHLVAMQQRVMMRAIVESSFDGIVVLDQRRRVAHANSAAAEILGRPLGSLIGSRLGTLLPDDAIIPRDQSPGARELQIARDDGRVAFIELVARRLDMGSLGNKESAATTTDKPMMVLTFRDVTERRLALTALHEALTEAQSASRLKSEFLAAMGHELRTPLNAILGFSEMIRDRRLGSSLARYVDYAGEIHASGQRLSTLVETMLDFALAASGKLRLDRTAIDLDAVLRSAIGEIMPVAERNDIRLALVASQDEAPTLIADGQRVREIAGHLLSNGIKFTPKGGSLSVRILRRDEAAGFEICDTGIGMTATEIETAFKPFTQVDGRLERLHEGAGLGLPLAKKLVELHGGTLTIASTPGEGTTVRVWLPLDTPARAAA